MGEIHFHDKAKELEKELLTFTSSMKAAKNEREFNELIEGAIEKMEHSRIKFD